MCLTQGPEACVQLQTQEPNQDKQGYVVERELGEFASEVTNPLRKLNAPDNTANNINLYKINFIF